MFGRKNTSGTTSSLAGSPSGPPEVEEGRRGGSLVRRANVRRGGWSATRTYIYVPIYLILGSLFIII